MCVRIVKMLIKIQRNENLTPHQQALQIQKADILGQKSRNLIYQNHARLYNNKFPTICKFLDSLNNLFNVQMNKLEGGPSIDHL